MSPRDGRKESACSMTLTKQKTHRWTDEERAIIRREYKHTRKSLQWLAEYLTVYTGDKISIYAVRGQIQGMGIAKSDDRRPWTPKEDEALRRLVGKYNVRKVARQMHRGEGSIRNRVKRLNISLRQRTGWFTKSEVMEIVGHDHKWVQARIDSGAIEATWHHDKRPTAAGLRYWHITEQALVKFIRTYPEELVGCNIDIVTIVDMLAGIINHNHGEAE
jgi:hypothetical protein